MHVHIFHMYRNISSIFLIPSVKAVSIKEINSKCVINAENIFCNSYLAFVYVISSIK